ncbi:MAG TPA: hypothetical protein VN827_06615 [Chthoniobacterales bacterium]|nr:hypothetical protein [Chthoniobacterales bacterium]
MKATARCLIVAITICSWIAISNHCALRAIITMTDTTQSGCPFHSKPAKPQPQPAGTECCKILRAVSTMPAKILAPAIVNLAQVDFAFNALAVFPPPKISFTPATLDTGPPGRTSFVELIGSMRAHAPPSHA